MPDLRLSLKWPNDVWLSSPTDPTPDRRGRLREQLPGGKLAGILCERSGAVVAVGIGLNRDPQWQESPQDLRLALSGRPASLADHGIPPAELDLVDGLRRYLLEAAGLLNLRGFAALVGPWRDRDVLRGRTITIRDGNAAGGEANGVTGTAIGIDHQGRLLLETANGIQVFTSGQIA